MRVEYTWIHTAAEKEKRFFCFVFFKGESSLHPDALKICSKRLFILAISQTGMECKAFGRASHLSDCPFPAGVRSSILISACRSCCRRLPLWSARLDDSVLTIALQPIIFQIPELCSQRSVGCFSGMFILLADYLPPCFLLCKLPPLPHLLSSFPFIPFILLFVIQQRLTFLAPQLLNSSHQFIRYFKWMKENAPLLLCC